MPWLPSALVLLLSGVSVSVHAGDRAVESSRSALVIGNARYEAAAGPLRNTVNDARAVAATLKQLGFQVKLKENTSRDQLLRLLLDFRSTLAGKEVALFYFAGHGIHVGGANYLLPIQSGYAPEGADDVTLRLMAETRLFNVEQAVADLKSGGARCNLVILDACRTTAMARTGRTRDAADSASGFAEMKPPAGSLIAFATDAGQTALDGDGANGLYTEELLRHLRTPGLAIEQVFKRTRAGVLERSNGQQVPAEYSRLVGEDIYLAGGTASEVAAPMTAAAGTRPVEVPELADINRLVSARQVPEAVAALCDRAEGRGAENAAAMPLAALLDQVKELLKKPDLRDADSRRALEACDLVMAALPRCLPAAHPQHDDLLAKAHNRRGDSLLALGRADDALEAFNSAIPLAPDDAYILYNRARAHQALGDLDNARRDLREAADARFNQPKARELAMQLLEELEK